MVETKLHPKRFNAKKIFCILCVRNVQKNDTCSKYVVNNGAMSLLETSIARVLSKSADSALFSSIV